MKRRIERRQILQQEGFQIADGYREEWKKEGHRSYIGME